MIKCNVCDIEKETHLFRNKKKNPLCLECYCKQKKEKYRLDNPKFENVCKKCGIEKENDNFQKGRNVCKDCMSLYIKEYYKENKERILEIEKNRYYDNKESVLERQKNYNMTVKNKRKDYQKEYREKNKDVLKEKRKLYNPVRLKRHKERYSNDLKYKISKIHRSILKSFLTRMKKGPKTDKTNEILGYSYSELKIHIESLFLEGMTWDNHGEWHIDHIKPLSLFDIDTPANVVNSLSNLQPIWAIDNLKKSNKYEL